MNARGTRIRTGSPKPSWRARARNENILLVAVQAPENMTWARYSPLISPLRYSQDVYRPVIGCSCKYILNIAKTMVHICFKKFD